MGSKAIEYRNGQFHSVLCTMSPTELVRDTLGTLLSGEEMTRFGVTATYALQMLRHVGKTGEFVDFTDWGVGDHDFDPNTPTPGHHWATKRLTKKVLGPLAGLFDSVLFLAPQLGFAAEVHLEEQSDKRRKEKAFQLPSLKQGCSNVSDNEIRYHAGSQSFHFGEYQIGMRKLASIIVNHLMAGDEWVRIGDFDVTVNYLEGMVRVAGKYGQFCDFNDAEFDPNVAPANTDWEWVD